MATKTPKAAKSKEQYCVSSVKYADPSGKCIFNDCHTKETNPGFSRNKLGGFYTK